MKNMEGHTNCPKNNVPAGDFYNEILTFEQSILL